MPMIAKSRERLIRYQLLRHSASSRYEMRTPKWEFQGRPPTALCELPIPQCKFNAPSNSRPLCVTFGSALRYPSKSKC
jgi:hypothetical protein